MSLKPSVNVPITGGVLTRRTTLMLVAGSMLVVAGLVGIIVVDRHKAQFWKQVFPKITVHDDIVVRSGAISVNAD